MTIARSFPRPADSSENTGIRRPRIWFRDGGDPCLWHHASGLIDEAALEERSFYCHIVRVLATTPQGTRNRS